MCLGAEWLQKGSHFVTRDFTAQMLPPALFTEQCYRAVLTVGEMGGLIYSFSWVYLSSRLHLQKEEEKNKT